MSTKLPNTSFAAHQAAAENTRMSGEDRRRQLITVAIGLFSQKGFTGTTTKEIAAAANVNEAIIFRHFATKDDLYAAILDYKANEVCAGDWLEELREHAARRDDEAVFRTVAEKRLSHHRCDRDDQFLRLMFYSALEGHTLARVFLERQVRPIREFLCAYIEERQREGAFREAHPRAVVNAFIGALNNHVMTNAFFKDWRLDISDEEAISNYTNLLLGGLRAQQATKNQTTKEQAVKTPRTARTCTGKALAPLKRITKAGIGKKKL